jgi:D-sedoheptulose 7-phosphate isomerase
MINAEKEVLRNFKAAAETLENSMRDQSLMTAIANFANLATETLKNGNNIFVCGNGGSHCDAMHFAEELTGRYRKNRRPLGALALGDASHMTCVGNDYGFEHIFSRQLEGLAKNGDLLIGISTSGNSKNVILAIEVAKAKGLKTVALLGKDGGAMKSMVDIPVIIKQQATDRIQEVHIKIIHSVIEIIEMNIFPELYTTP